MTNPRQHKGIYYWPTKDDAEKWAKANDWPVRIVGYGLGFAVQAGPSGNYAGPFVSPRTWAEAFESLRTERNA